MKLGSTRKNKLLPRRGLFARVDHHTPRQIWRIARRLNKFLILMNISPRLLTAIASAALLSVASLAQPAALQKKDVTLAPAKILKTKLPLAYTIPTVDISGERSRQVTVDREAGQYLGHPTTVLLEDGRTILAVYPKGHGRGAIIYKRSNDGGKTWSDRLPTPKSWETSLEVPTLHRVADAAGKKRLIVFSGLYPIRMAVSADDGATWSEPNPLVISVGS